MTTDFVNPYSIEGYVTSQAYCGNCKKPMRYDNGQQYPTYVCASCGLAWVDFDRAGCYEIAQKASTQFQQSLKDKTL